MPFNSLGLIRHRLDRSATTAGYEAIFLQVNYIRLELEQQSFCWQNFSFKILAVAKIEQ